MLPAPADLSRATHASLVEALRARKLDRTVTGVGPGPAAMDPDATGASGIPGLDAGLGGGLPRGQVSEVVGRASSGRTSLLLQWMAAATARGELVAIIDVCDRFDPPSAEAAGVDLSRVLWVRGQAPASRGSRDAQTRALQQAIKAAALVLQAGNFGLVALDVAEVSPLLLRAMPFTTWLRLERLIEGSQTMGLIVAPEPLARSAGGVSVRLETDAAAARFRNGLFDGVRLRAQVARARLRPAEAAPISFATAAVHGR